MSSQKIFSLTLVFHPPLRFLSPFMGFYFFILLLLLLLYGPQVDPLFFSLFLFSCRMARGHEEVLTSQDGCMRGIPRETPTASSLVAAISEEELRLYSQIPIRINLETSDGVATTIVEEVDNVVYFTQERFVAGLHLLIPLLVKQFLHFTRAPLALIYPNVFRILMGCSVLNTLYQLDISMVEICFIYTLKLGIGSRISMSTHSPRLQFVTRLPDSPKTVSLDSLKLL